MLRFVEKTRNSHRQNGTFSPSLLSLVDRADSLLLNVGE